MWGVPLTQATDMLSQASMLPASDPLQLIVGLLLTMALVAAR